MKPALRGLWTFWHVFRLTSSKESMVHVSAFAFLGRLLLKRSSRMHKRVQLVNGFGCWRVEKRALEASAPRIFFFCMPTCSTSSNNRAPSTGRLCFPRGYARTALVVCLGEDDFPLRKPRELLLRGACPSLPSAIRFTSQASFVPSTYAPIDYPFRQSASMACFHL